MIRGSKVGDAVYVKPIAGREVDGVIVCIEKDGLRQVMTDTGEVWATPDELYPSTAFPNAKPVSVLAPGDRIVLLNGTVRTVQDRKRASGGGWVISFVEDAPPRRQGSPDGMLWRLAPIVDDGSDRTTTEERP